MQILNKSNYEIFMLHSLQYIFEIKSKNCVKLYLKNNFTSITFYFATKFYFLYYGKNINSI